MGDRISIRFVNNKSHDEPSPYLFSHWQGKGLLDYVDSYMDQLKKTLAKKEEGISNPIDRLEPGTVMVDFIRHITKDMEIVDSDLYLTSAEDQGDNSDNGHHDIELK